MSKDSNDSREESPNEDPSGEGWKTLALIVGFLIAIEIGLSILLSVPAIGDSGIGRYFDYGSSTETKIRKMATNPNLPSNSVFYAGWLDPKDWPTIGEVDDFADIAIYGMSYAGRLIESLERVDPSLRLRMIGGPGVPLSHSYAAYQMDVRDRTAKVVLITLLPRGIADMTSMTHDTSFIDHSQPSTWPIYQRSSGPSGEGGVELKAWPVINTAEELRRAVTEDPVLWEKHLASLESADEHFRRFLFASHWSEKFVMGRVLRRAWAKSIERESKQGLLGADGNFDPRAEASLLTRGVLRAFIGEVRANGEKPVVVLFSQPGSRDQLYHLVGDVLEETRVDYITSEDFCDSTVGDHYRDMHFIPRCNDAIARGIITALSDDLRRSSTPAKRSPSAR